MKEIISKELLAEAIMCKDIWSINIYETDIDTLRYAGLENNCGGSINIYKLAYLCKEWAFKNSYLIDSSKFRVSIYPICRDGWQMKLLHYIDISKNSYEVEAIFQACQFILDNKDKK